MNIQVTVILILGFILVYFLLIELFSVLLQLSGLTKEKANFQAISLLTAVGFTTAESEIITSNRTRRRIATIAMIIGYSFSVVIMSLVMNLVIGLNTTQQEYSLTFILISGGVFLVLMIIIKLTSFNRLIEKIGERIMYKKSKINTITMLDNYGSGAIYEIHVNWVPEFLFGKSLLESGLKDLYNISIMMIKRREKIIDVTRDTIIQKGDIIIVFGSHQNIKDAFSVNVKEVEEILDTKKDLNNEIDLIDNYGKDAMAEIKINKVPEVLTEKTLMNSGIKDKYQINVLMLKRNGSPLSVSRDTKIQESDEIVVFGPYKQIKEVFIVKDLPSEAEIKE